MIQIEVGLVSEDSSHGDQHEVSKQLLFDTPFRPGVKILNLDGLLARLEELLHTPPGVVEVHEVLSGEAVDVDKRGTETKRRSSDPVLDEPELQGHSVTAWVLLSKLCCHGA